MTGTTSLPDLDEVNGWDADTEELMAALGVQRLEVWSGSPILDVVASHAGPASAPSAPGADAPALDAIARPEIALALLHSPPEDARIEWFFAAAGDRAFTAYRRDENDGRHHVTWPVSGALLAAVLQGVLDLEEPALPEDEGLVLDPGGLSTLCAITDVLQEEALLALLQRRETPPVAFDAQDLLACTQRGLGGEDLRWVGPRVRRLAPIPLIAGIEDFERGLTSFAERGLLRREGETFRVADAFGMRCALLADCAGMCAVGRRMRAELPDGSVSWRHDHVAAARGIDSLWLFDFGEVSHDAFTLTLRAVSAEELRERLTDQLSDPASVVCGGCGAALQVGKRFCGDCGRPVAGGER